MAFVASYKSRVFVGSLGWHAYATGFDFADATDMLESTVLQDTSKQFIPGAEGSTLNIATNLDTGTAGQFAAFNTWKGTPQVETLLWAGTTRGTECLMVQANQSQFTVASPVAGIVTANGSQTVDGTVDFGVVLDPETAITANTNGAAVDNGASTANGCVAHLHVTAFSGLTSDTILVEHSTDNVSFTTLGTFTTVTGTTSQRLVIAPGTTVNRYVRVKDTVVGTGSCTRIVTFSRR